MKDIDALLQEHHLDRHEIEELLQQNEKMQAIKLVFDKTGIGLKNSKDLVEAVQRKETHFTEDNSSSNSNVSVKTFNKNGQLTVKLKLNNQPEKVVFPSDPDWVEVKRVMGDKPELIAYEKEYLENPIPFQKQKSTLFIEEDNSNKWKFVLLASVLALAIIYFIYSN
ncbi:hypothetical protein [Chryseobacterium sp. FH1]|uniref:hypothetical protein n=1 Tax=Chryseobacterium sp. FH1 TaxID=1233951 RepID=UPI00103B50C1|nr:hypothetical protein [Chryseobacterium sp. FH1]